MAMTLPDPSFVIAGSELCYLPTLMLPEPLPRICSEVGLQDSVQAFGVVQQDLVLRDIIRFDGKGFVVVEGVPATFEECCRGREQWARRSLAQIESGLAMSMPCSQKFAGSPRCQGIC